MRITGEWLRFDDGVTRPIIRARIRDVAGRVLPDRFLVDSGADRTVLSADLLRDLHLSVQRPATGSALLGVGGDVAFVLVSTALEFLRDDGTPVTVRGEYAAFTDPRATDLSILGRDVLDNFDVIISRRRGEVMLLAPNHRYQVTPT
jgi:hypothetical protein